MLRSSRLRKVLRTGGLMVACALAGGALFSVSNVSSQSRARGGTAERNAADLVTRGRQIFRFDTFGDEAFWSGALQLDKAIAGSKNGGVGPGVSPATALKLVYTSAPARCSAGVSETISRVVRLRFGSMLTSVGRGRLTGRAAPS